MAYRPTKVGSSGVSGRATIKLGTKNGNKVVYVKLWQGQKGNEKVEEYYFSPKKCPNYIQAGEFFVSLTPEKDGIRGMRPINGQNFRGKVSKFLSAEGKPPVPRTKSNEYEGNAYTYQYFTVLIEITYPERYKGMECIFMPRYHFGETVEVINGKPEHVVAITKQKSKYTGILEDFLEATGVWEKGAIRYSDNILPILQKRMLDSNREFGFSLKDSWIQYIVVPDPNELEQNDDWSESVETDSDDGQLSFNGDGWNETNDVEDVENNGWGSPEVEDFKENDEDDSSPWDEIE